MNELVLHDATNEPTAPTKISLLRRIRRRAGFTLLELTMSLAIIAVLIGGIVMFFSNASTAQRTNDTMAELGNIQQAVHSMYSGQPNYSGLTTATIANSSQIPAKWGGGTGALTDPFGGAVNLSAQGTAITGGPAANGAFVVEMDNLPAAACAKVVTQDLGPSLIGVGVGTAPTTITGPLLPATAQASCVAGSVNVFWVLY